MAITLFGAAASIADTGTGNGPTVAVTPPASMVSGHVVVMTGSYRSNAVTLTVGEAGGQTWTSLAQITQGTSLASRAFVCVFNGTWSANPSVTVTAGTGLMTTCMYVFAGVDNTTPQDAAAVVTGHATPSSPFNITSAGITTVTDGAMVLAHFTSEDNNTWALQTGSLANALGTQIRNSTTFSTSEGYGIFATAGATGNLTNQQATLGGDQAVSMVIALRPAAGGSSDVLIQGMQLPQRQLGTQTAVRFGGLLQE